MRIFSHRYVRITALAGAALIIVVGFATTVILWNQDRIISSMLESVKQSTGAEISARSTALRIRSGLIVVLDEPTVVARGREMVKLESLRVVLGWRAIIFNRGLPLRSLILQRPQLVVAAQEFATSETAWRHPGERTLQALLGQLEWLSGATRRIEVVDAVVRDDHGGMVCDDLDAVAYRVRGLGNRWRAGFNATVARPPVQGLRLSGDLTLGDAGAESEDAIASGKLWFWDAPIDLLDSPRIKPSGRLQGAVEVMVTRDGAAHGSVQFDVHQLIVGGEAVGATLNLGDFTLKASFNASARKYQLADLTLADSAHQVFGGQFTIDEPYSANPNVAITVSGLEIDLAKAKQRIVAARDVPRDVKDALGALESGTITIENAALKGTLKEMRAAEPDLVRRALVLNATLRDVAMQPPAQTKLPRVERLSAHIAFANGALALTQGGARVGDSTLEALRVKASFAAADDGIIYDVTARGDALLGDLYPAIEHELATRKFGNTERVKSLGGRVRFQTQIGGRVRASLRDEPPSRYTFRLEPLNARIELNDPPSVVEIPSGVIVLDRDLLKIERIEATDHNGTAHINGDLNLSANGPRAKGIQVKIDAILSQYWLPLLVDAKALAPIGPISGNILVRNDPHTVGRFLANGELLLVDGSVQLGFLRAPILTKSAKLTFTEHNVDLHLTQATLEESPIDFRLVVADFNKPVLEIFANVERLDFEAMKFVKMPWSPRGKSSFFNVLSQGHIEVANGNLAAFNMSRIKTDFITDRGDWKVHNYSAVAYGGQMNIELSGRKRDFWLNIKGTIKGMEAGPLFRLSNPTAEPAMVGKMDLMADLWGDTGEEFFNTLAGTASLTTRNGRLNRFTLLSRLLEFIDLKSWLTARFPDPRLAGLPFELVLADFTGARGLFWTENFLLHGPAMEISAIGSLDIGNSELNMEVGMSPFRTVNWLIEQVPLVGSNVAEGTGHLVAAYFQVSGPISDPTVMPKPITSAAAFFKKFFSIPINVVRPKTIK
ncbi:MAG: AsmA-like C-terminal domain-containing protein [Candidatus Binataceae bacterium]